MIDIIIIMDCLYICNADPATSQVTQAQRCPNAGPTSTVVQRWADVEPMLCAGWVWAK